MPVHESDGGNGSGRSGIDPHPLKSDANALSHFNDSYVSGADSGVEGTPQKKFDEHGKVNSDGKRLINANTLNFHA